MVFCMSMLLFLLLHLRHYPVTVSLLSLFLLRIIVDARVERVIVSEDRFIIVTRHLLPFLNKKRVVLFSAIESIHIPPGNVVNKEAHALREHLGFVRAEFP